jgi:hypothetical protein
LGWPCCLTPRAVRTGCHSPGPSRPPSAGPTWVGAGPIAPRCSLAGEAASIAQEATWSSAWIAVASRPRLACPSSMDRSDRHRQRRQPGKREGGDRFLENLVRTPRQSSCSCAYKVKRTAGSLGSDLILKIVLAGAVFVFCSIFLP